MKARRVKITKATSARRRPLRQRALKTKATERLPESSPTSVSTEISAGGNLIRDAIEDGAPETSDIERAMTDYYAESDVERQGGVPREAPETPMFQEGPHKRGGTPDYNI